MSNIFDKEKPNWNNLHKIEKDNKFKYEAERIKRIFAKRLDEVFKLIEPNYTPLWIAVQIGMSKQSIMRYLRYSKQPTLSSFYRIVDFIQHKIPDFNIRYLFDKDAEMYIENKIT